MKIKPGSYFLIVLFAFLSLPFCYVIASLFLGFIKVNGDIEMTGRNTFFYLNTNGVHLDIILKKDDLSEELKKGLIFDDATQYVSFAWGDEQFYLTTPEWKDLTFETAFIAVFLESPALIHITKYKNEQKKWQKIYISKEQLNNLNHNILNEFKFDDSGNKIILKGKGYTENDDFYKAVKYYTLFYTCNTWVNDVFKESGLPACLWTPFDFPVMDKYKNDN